MVSRFPLARKRYVVVLSLLAAAVLQAEQDRDNNAGDGLHASVGLRHRVVIPQIIYFRIGSPAPGTVDRIQFNASNPAYPAPGSSSHAGGAPYLGSAVPIEASGNGELDVTIMANVSSLNLSYDLSDPQGLGNGSGEFIPYDEIDVQSSDAGLPAPALANAGTGGVNSVTVNGNLHAGRVIQRQVRWTYRYRNTGTPLAGTYEGQVRYTLASP